MTETIKILLVDDHSLVRDGIKMLLEEEVNLEVIGEATNGQEALTVINELKPDIAIFDIRMPVMNGIEAVRKLNEQASTTKGMVLSMHDSEEYVLQSIEAGALGYLLKDAPKEELIKAIYLVAAGEKYYSGDISKIVVNKYLESLTPSAINPEVSPQIMTLAEDVNLTKREKQILSLVLLGRSNKEIAQELEKSVRTIETHRFNLMKKLNVKNVAELARKADSLLS